MLWDEGSKKAAVRPFDRFRQPRKLKILGKRIRTRAIIHNDEGIIEAWSAGKHPCMARRDADSIFGGRFWAINYSFLYRK
jgi:hypothetical protein